MILNRKTMAFFVYARYQFRDMTIFRQFYHPIIIFAFWNHDSNPSIFTMITAFGIGLNIGIAAA